MTLNKKEAIKKLYNFCPDFEAVEKLNKWEELFIQYNSHTNLMSKNDVNVLFEKHVLDSLAITLVEDFHSAKTILDIGTGGGFPSVILSVFFPDKKIYALDSIKKKINFIEIVKNELGLDNLYPVLGRAEDLPPLNADIVTSRAVGKISLVWKNSKHHLKKEGVFVSYKSLTAKEEAFAATKEFAELKNPKFVPYVLPLDENLTRELVIFQMQ